MLPLLCHTSCTAPAGLAVSAAAVLEAGSGLQVKYRLAGAADTLLVPAPASPGTTDGLWRHTCCEAFVAAVDAPEYREFNLSPSGRWAAFRFPRYRERDTAWHPAAAPAIAIRKDGGGLQLTAAIPAALLPAGDALRVALAVVAEDRAGGKSYWALAHPTPQPDFHLRDSFTLRLERR